MKNTEKKSKSKTKKVRVSYPPWSDAEKSWFLLTESNKDETAWSEGKWFPKKVCKLKQSKNNPNVGILRMPEWLYNEKYK